MTGLAAVVLAAGALVPSAGAVGAAPPDPVPVGGVLADAPPPATFTRTGDADPGQVLHLALGLTRDTAALEARVLAAATPGTAAWGRHLAIGEVAAGWAAPTGTARAALDALAAAGIPAWLDASGMYVHATPTVAQAGSLFEVTFAAYQGPGSVGGDIAWVAAEQAPTVPPTLDGLVAELTGLTQALPYVTYPPSGGGAPARALPPAPTNTGTPAGCRDAVTTGAYTQGQLATAYGLDALAPPDGRLGAGARVAVLIDGDGLSRDALATFRACFAVAAPDPVIHVVPPQDAPIQTAVGELQGDVETILGLAPHLDRLDVYQGVGGLNQWPLLFSAPLEAVAAGAPAPAAVTLSDADCERTVPPAVVRLLDDVLLVHAAVGITVSLPAGDFGSQSCDDLPGTSQLYPSTSPWVAAIGGTIVALDRANGVVGEVVWNDNAYQGFDTQATGGGPSRLFPRPVWQVGAGAFPDVRGVPDVSFFASAYPGVTQAVDLGPPIGISWFGSSGTSYASPLFATGVALVDVHLAVRGLGTLGLVTPLLYHLAAAEAAGDPVAAGVVRDITEGTNDLAGVGCCAAGPGYDLASGLGSVRFDRLAAAAAALGPPPAPGPTMTTSSVGAPAATGSTPPVTLPVTGPTPQQATASLGVLLLLVGVGLLVAADRWRRARR